MVNTVYLTVVVAVSYLACVEAFNNNPRGRFISTRCRQLRYPFCRLQCPQSGYAIDSHTRCPVCRCQNRCEEVSCSPGYTCQLEAVSRRCGFSICKVQVAECVPGSKPDEIENICEAGIPNGYCFGNVSPLVNCVGDYKCVIAPNSRYGLCCLKPEAASFSNLPMCEQPKKVGPCRAFFRRYFFNSASGQCERFVYSGCQGNENNFETKQDCESSCRNYCSLPADPGFCYALVRKYYYDASSRTCRLFNYGGCGGNGNNFSSKRECLNFCSFKRSL
ncbi:boophilin-H2-like [Argonauta hians]